MSVLFGGNFGGGVRPLSKPGLKWARFPPWQKYVLFALAYFACAEGSMLFNIASSPNASFWLPAGLYVAVLLLSDYKSWPWLVLAATAANIPFDVMEGTPAKLMLVFILANTVEAVAGAWLVRTLVAKRPTIETLKDYVSLLFFTGILATLLGAAVSAAGQKLTGTLISLPRSFWSWWGSTAMATLIVMPFIITWFSNDSAWWTTFKAPKRRLEALALLVGLIGMTWWILVLGPGINSPNKSPFLVFLLWAGLRFGIRGATAVNILFSLFAAFLIQHYRQGLTATDLASGVWVMGTQVSLAVGTTLGLVPAFVLREHDKALEDLRKSEERFQLAVRGSTDGIWDWNILTGNVFYSDRYLELLGYLRAEFPDNFAAFESVLHPDDANSALQSIQSHLKQRMPVDIEVRLRTKAGDYRWFRGRGQAIWNTQEQPVRMAGSITDITVKKTSEQLLREGEEKFSKAFRSSPNGIALTELDTGRYIEVNDSFGRIFGYAKEEMVGRTSLELGVFDNPAHREQVIGSLRTVGQIKDSLLHMRTRDGEAKTLLFSAERIELGGKQYTVSVIFDITSRLATEKQLESTTRQLRALTRRLQSLREEERTHLAREIHDHLGQLLTALGLDLRLIERRAAGVADAELRASLHSKIASARQLADETVTAVQKIATELRPAILDRLGLEAAIEVEAEAFQSRTGVNCRWTLPSTQVALEPDQATAIFRIFQEILTNVARHAHAAHLAVHLSHADHRLLLEVDDDGVGIQPNDIANSTSLGLLGMKERVAILGGRINFSRRDPHGTTVTVQIPLNGKAGFSI